jgi:hypothetical protein
MKKLVALILLGFWMTAPRALAQSLPSGEETRSLIVAQARFKEFKPLPGEQVVRGEIVKIEAGSYLVKDTEGKEVRLKVDEQTILRAKFKPGDRIQAHISEAGTASVIKYMTEKMEGQKTPGAVLPPDTETPQAGPLTRQDLSESISSGLLPGHRIVKGTVEEVKADMVRVNLGELKTRPLPVKQAQEKGIESLKEGDRLELIINSENGVVDYHREGQPGQHRIIRGRVAETADGVEWAMILQENGKKERYAVQPEARSRIKRAYTGAPALFLIGEEDKILDAVPENAPEVQLPVKGSDNK